MKSVSKKLVDWKFDHTNIWHWLAVIIAVVILVFAGYCIVKGVTWLTGGGLKSIDMFQNTSSQLQEIEPYKRFNTLKPTVLNTSPLPYNVYGFNWYNIYLTNPENNKYLLTSFYVGTSNKDDIFNTTKFANLVPYFDTFEIARIYEWQTATTDPKIITYENRTPGFIAFRPNVTAKVNNIEYTTLGDLYVSGDAPEFNDIVTERKDSKYIGNYAVNLLLDTNTIKNIVGFSGYVQYNKSYLTKAPKINDDDKSKVWDDDGSKGRYDHNIVGKSGYYSVLSKNDKQYTFTASTSINLITTPNRITVVADPRNIIYKLNTEKFEILGSIKFQGADFPTLNKAPEQPCEVLIRVSNSANDGTTNYLSISTTMNTDTQTYSLGFTSDKTAASRFFVNYSEDKQKVIILSKIDPSMPRTEYNYVMGVDAINCDSSSPYAAVRMYPLSSPVNIKSTTPVTIKPLELSYKLRNQLNQLQFYHNAGYPFYQFDISGANLNQEIISGTLSLDSVAGTKLAGTQKFLFTGTELKFCNTTTNPAFAFDIAEVLPTVTAGDKLGIGPLFTVSAGSSVSSQVYRQVIGTQKYTALVIYDPSNSATNGKNLDIKTENGYSFTMTEQPVYFKINENTMSLTSRYAKDGVNYDGCVLTTTYPSSDNSPKLTSVVDTMANTTFTEDILKDKTLKLRPAGQTQTYMYMNSDTNPKLVYQIGAPVGEANSPRIYIKSATSGLNTLSAATNVRLSTISTTDSSQSYMYYIPDQSSQPPTYFNTTSTENILTSVNQKNNTGTYRQYFENPGIFRLAPKLGSVGVYSIAIYMSNGNYIPLNDIELVDVTPPETTTTTTTIPETTTTTTIPETSTTTTIPETSTTTTTIPETTTTTTQYTASDTPAPTEAITTTTTQYKEPGDVIDAIIGTGLKV